MRFFETVTLVLIIIAFVNLVAIKHKTVGLVLPSISIISGILSMIFEGYRIQMLPTYILALVMLIAGIIKVFLKPHKVKMFLTIGGMSILSLALVIAAAFPILLPVVNLSAPSGAYSVGTTYMSFTDTSRKGIFTNSGGSRKLAVQVWYPSDNVKGLKAQSFFSSTELSTYMEKRLGMPNFLSQLTLDKTHSYLNATLSSSKKKYPVIVFSDGYSSFAGQNTVQMEELASHGYIVFSIAHTYEDFASIFPDGSIIPFKQAQVNAFQKDMSDTGEKYSESRTTADYEKYVIKNVTVVNKSLKVWVDDTSFVADEIENLQNGNISSIFDGKLDTSKMGVFGHSFGGATAGQVCLTDKRFKAFINMDGTPFGNTVDTTINQPFMVMCTDSDKDMILGGYSKKQKNYSIVCINGAKHADFMDFTELVPSFRYLGMLGTIGGTQQEKIVNDYVLSFFNKYLNGTQESLIDQKASKYPQVTVELR